MTKVEIPYAPVDHLIREAVGDMRVSAEAGERLSMDIQNEGAKVAQRAAANARRDGRKTLRPGDFEFDAAPGELSKEALLLPVAPVDRIARLRADDVRVSREARLSLTRYLEEWALDVADAAGKLASHADRRTVLAEDVEAYFEVCGGEDSRST